MDTIDQTRTKLADLRVQLQSGKVFGSTGEIAKGIILNSLQHESPTEVKLPNDDEVRELIKELQEDLQNGSLTNITDKELDNLIMHLGSPNSDIRDKGIFFLLNDLIQNQILSDDQLILMFDHLLNENVLFNHITEEENDGVYGRSFSVMMLSTLIYVDRAGRNFIDPERKNFLVEQMAMYIVLENDTRGFNGSHGWVHAYTHIGNVLDELAGDPDLIRADKVLLLAILFEKYRAIQTPLIFGEPNRLATYLANQFQEDEIYRQFGLIELREWRRSLTMNRIRETEGMWNAMFNRQRLLQALILNPNLPQDIIDYLEDTSDFTM